MSCREEALCYCEVLVTHEPKKELVLGGVSCESQAEGLSSCRVSGDEWALEALYVQMLKPRPQEQMESFQDSWLGD